MRAGLTPTACVRAIPGCACRRRPGGQSTQASPRFLTKPASEPLVDRLYPRTFTYHRGDGHPDEEHPLFGDLVDAVRHAVDTEADARSS